MDTTFETTFTPATSLEVIASLRSALSAVMRVENHTIHEPPVDLLEFTGKLTAPSDEAFQHIYKSFIAYGYTPMLTERDGVREPKGTEAILLISAGGGAPSQADERASFAKNVLRTIQGFNNLRLQSQEPMRIGGQPGYEVRANGKDAQGADIEIIQWLRFGTGAYLRILGFAPKDKWQETFTRFREVRDGLEPR